MSKSQVQEERAFAFPKWERQEVCLACWFGGRGIAWADTGKQDWRGSGVVMENKGLS